MLGKNFSGRHFEIFFLIFPRKWALTFHAHCLLRGEAYFLGKDSKNIIDLSSAEYAQRMYK